MLCVPVRHINTRLWDNATTQAKNIWKRRTEADAHCLIKEKLIDKVECNAKKEKENKSTYAHSLTLSILRAIPGAMPCIHLFQQLGQIINDSTRKDVWLL